MRFLTTLSDAVNRAVIVLCAAFVLAMLSVSFIGAFYQAATGASLSWTYSLARQFVPWIGLLAITVAFKNGEHVAVAMLVNRLPAGPRGIVEYVVVFSIGLFALLLLYEGTRFFLESTQLVMISDQIQISQRWVAASVPATGLVLLMHMVCGRDLLEGPRTASETTEGIVFDTDHIEAPQSDGEAEASS